MTSLHLLPIALLALCIAIYLFSQRSATWANNEYTRWQLNNIDKQKTQLVDMEKQLKEAHTQREPSVKAHGATK